MREVLSEVSGRCEGGVENRPPSPKPLCTQVFSEVEGGLALKMKNPCFFWIPRKTNERKGRNLKILDAVLFRKRSVYFYEQPVYFCKQPIYAKNPLKLVTFSGRLRLFYKLFCIFVPIIDNITLTSTQMMHQTIA